jgi:ubiquinone/menaquinone biosynthesis C-methylase UbiE
MNADPLARWYRWIEYAAFGRALERGRCVFLPELAAARRVLVFGEGDGRTLEQLLRIAPAARVDVIEASAEMIALERRRAGTNLDRVRFLEADALTVELQGEEYDATLTHFFLDCFSESDALQLIYRIKGAMKPGAIWLVTDFTIPAAGWRRWYATVLIGIMYKFFRFSTGLKNQALPNIDELLERAGLRQKTRLVTRLGLIAAEVWVKISN